MSEGGVRSRGLTGEWLTEVTVCVCVCVHVFSDKNLLECNKPRQTGYLFPHAKYAVQPASI